MCCSSGDERELGFIFSSTNESEVVLLRDVLLEFLVKSWRDIKSNMTPEAGDLRFTSCDSVSLLIWKIDHSSLVLSDRGMPPSELTEFQLIKVFAREFPAKKYFFSHSGGLIAVDEGGRIVLFEGKNLLQS